MRRRRRRSVTEFTKTLSGSIDRQSHGKLLEKIFAEIDGLQNDVSDLIKSRGTKESPARTCKDIYLEFPAMPDGWYWVDPNLGVPMDAINVYCNMTAKGETCVYPETESRLILTQFWTKDVNNPDQLFSKFPGGRKISYINEIQMNFLRILHNEAHQAFTYFCRNSVAWYDAKSKSHDLALSLVGANGHEVQAGDFRQRDVELDGCSYRPADGATVLKLKSTRMQQFPIVDFRPKDYGSSGQEFGFEAGPVCFK